MALPTGLQHPNCRQPPFWEWHRLYYLGRVSEVRLWRINFWQCPAISVLLVKRLRSAGYFAEQAP
jgi:hypothetical protein